MRILSNDTCLSLTVGTSENDDDSMSTANRGARVEGSNPKKLRLLEDDRTTSLGSWDRESKAKDDTDDDDSSDAVVVKRHSLESRMRINRASSLASISFNATLSPRK